MNIGLFYGSEAFPPSTGSTVHRYHLSKGLTERGHKLSCWYFGNGLDPNCKLFRGRQLFDFLAQIDLIYLRVDWNSRSRYLTWLRYLSRRRPPVIWELNGLPSEILFQGQSSAQLSKLERSLHSCAQSVAAGIGVTPAIRDFLQHDLKVPRSFDVPNGSDPELFQPREKTRDRSRPLQVVWMGTTSSKWHDLERVMSAAAVLESESRAVQFRIYGDERHLPNNLPSNVRPCGTADYLKLSEFIGDADVGLVLWKPAARSNLDGSPLKMFDYMACGLATITEEERFRGKVVRERNCGRTTDGSVDDLVKLLLELESDRDRCYELGRNGRIAVEDYYNWGRVADQTNAILTSVRGEFRP